MLHQGATAESSVTAEIFDARLTQFWQSVSSLPGNGQFAGDSFEKGRTQYLLEGKSIGGERSCDA